MLCLIKKELTANLRYMIFGLVIFVAYFFVFSYTDTALFTMCLIITFYAVSTTNLVLDERYKIDLLLTSLPIRRRDVILSKYLLVLVIYIFSFMLYTLLFFLGRFVGFDRAPELTLTAASLGFLAISLYNGITLPLSYKFGAQAMRWVSFILFFAVFFLGSFLGKLGLPGTAVSAIPLGNVRFSLLLLAAGFLVNVISYLVTEPIYRKKDL